MTPCPRCPAERETRRHPAECPLLEESALNGSLWARSRLIGTREATGHLRARSPLVTSGKGLEARPPMWRWR